MFKPVHKILLLLAFMLVLIANQPPSKAATSGRYALVIGNSAYTGSPPLKNPKNDAELISKTLKEVGFKVTTVTDANQRQMRRAMLDFARTLRNNKDSVGLFYYAGHGVQVRGINFMVPVTADIKDEEEVQFEGIDVNDFLNTMRSSKARLNIIILDACRNNPFARSFRSASRGLAPVQAASGTLIAYSTAPGDVAFDGNGLNSPYTLALSRFMRKGGIPVETVFKRVLAEVEDSTQRKQTPWVTGAFRGEFFFNGKQSIKKAPATHVNSASVQNSAPRSTPASLEKLFWESIVNSTNPASFNAYMTAFPNGTFNGLAKIKIAELEKKRVVASNTPPKNEGAQRSRTAEPTALPATDHSTTSSPSATADKPVNKTLTYRYIFPNSSRAPLARYRVEALNCHKLWLARNEIYYRKGYCFKSEKGIRIFNNANCTSPFVRLTSLESRNKRTIRTWEIRKRCRPPVFENLNLPKFKTLLGREKTNTRPRVRPQNRFQRNTPRIRRNTARRSRATRRPVRRKKTFQPQTQSTRQQFLE